MHHKTGHGDRYRANAAVRCITITRFGQGARGLAGNIFI
jgi:hypothetical protein